MDYQAKLKIYETLLRKWGPKLNLVAASTLEDLHTRHFTDSSKLVSYLSKDKKILDLGSGAGFPGMILAFMGFDIDLLECDHKKCIFLQTVARETATSVNIITQRAEDFYPSSKYDVIVSRAVASTPQLLQWAQPLVKQDGYGLFLKGHSVHEELKNINADSYVLYPSGTSRESFVLKICFT